jgi:hypothetical protein
MNGTTNAATLAMRFTPPMTTSARRMTEPTATIHGSRAQAPLIAVAMELVWTPGIRTPQARTVTAAKT